MYAYQAYISLSDNLSKQPARSAGFHLSTIGGKPFKGIGQGLRSGLAAYG